MAMENGGVLMLEAPPSSYPMEIIDPLLYKDDDYEDPTGKEEVDRLVEEEMRRSSKKHYDFLKGLPPLPKFIFRDDGYEVPTGKEEVDRLVEEEMRHSSKKHYDFLKGLPPLPKFIFRIIRCFPGNMRGQSWEASSANGYIQICGLEVPSVNKQNNDTAWRQAV